MAHSFVVTVPSNGSAVQVVDGTNPDPLEAGGVGILNTGTVDVLLGGRNGNNVYPLPAGQFYGCLVGGGEYLEVQVASTGSAGQLTVLKSG